MKTTSMVYAEGMASIFLFYLKMNNFPGVYIYWRMLMAKE